MRFIHASDLNLGMIPDGQKSWGRERGNALFSALDKIVDLVIQENADALFLTGQSFHFSPLKEDVERIRQVFARIPFCHILLFSKNSPDYHFLNNAAFPRNIHLIREEKEHLYVEDLNMEILAIQKYTGQEAEINEFSLQHSDAIPLLLCNTSKDCSFPSNREELEKLPFSFVALGGEYNKRVLLENRILYAGSPEPLGKEQLGEHGIYLGNIHPLQKKVDALDFIPIATVQYIFLHFHLDKETGTEALRSRLHKEIQKRGLEHIYRIKFSGDRDPETKITEELLPKGARVIEWIDKTYPLYDFYSLYKEHSNDLIGLYIRSYLKKGLNELSQKEQDALFYGVSALLQGGK